MGTQITITLDDDAYERAVLFAKLSSQDIDSVVSDTIQLAIPAVNGNNREITPIQELSDERVIELAELRMNPSQDAKFSELLDRQQEGLLTEKEGQELQVLMQSYQEDSVRKAIAISEAVKRGLMQPLSE